MWEAGKKILRVHTKEMLSFCECINYCNMRALWTVCDEIKSLNKYCYEMFLYKTPVAQIKVHWKQKG